ncbi:MAG: hypothetical protein CGW95_10805 [Phenylobacterium zucineum]|nr:MAG: hypothetical protein CGW95_10805 [Phenylobacterium zucineum]
MKLTSLVLIAALGGLALVGGCVRSKPESTTSSVKFDTGLPMTEFMGHVVDPAAFGFWKGSGTEETVGGTRELAPTTAEGWEALETSAAVLFEAGNMLQIPGRARDPVDHWNKYAQDLSARAAEGKAAAFKHDKQAVFETGAKIYQVCEACHAEYVIGPQIKTTGPAQGAPLPPWPTDLAARR